MINTINEYQFKDAFMSIRPDNFSYQGLTVLFDYFEELENDIGEQIELDVIAICCDYSEARYSEIYTDYIACKHNGKLNIYNDEIYQAIKDDPDLENEIILEYLQDNTMVLEVSNNTVIYQAF